MSASQNRPPKGPPPQQGPAIIIEQQSIHNHPIVKAQAEKEALELRDRNLHTSVYVAPPSKFPQGSHQAKCAHYLNQAFARYRKHAPAAPGSFNITLFKMELDNVLREEGLQNYDVEGVIRDGGGIGGISGA